MSSTNRGAERQKDDFYETPPKPTNLILGRLLPGDLSGRRILDPFAGRGAILDVCKARGAHTIGYEIDFDRASECVMRGHETYTGDGTTGSGDTFAEGKLTRGNPTHIVTNPPFGRALEAAKLCIASGLPTMMLLRLAFAETEERRVFHMENPSRLFVLSNRPSFLTKEMKKKLHKKALAKWEADPVTVAWRAAYAPAAAGGNGSGTTWKADYASTRPSPPGTDSCAYAWFCWGFGDGWEVLG